MVASVSLPTPANVGQPTLETFKLETGLMPELYPVRLEPHFDPRPWGSRDLRPVYAEAPGTEPIGEAWLTWDECRIANGPLAGAKLGELCRRFGRDLVGDAARETERFPLLVKFLFPRDKLSVQVHPDDEAAHRVGQPCGKNECWYVLAAEPGAQIGLGLKPGVTREQLAKAIRDVRAEELLNWVDIAAGDMIYVEAGTVHTIGPGSVLVETQQNSDTTYRLYDYGRPRELHIEQGIAAVKETSHAGKVVPSGDGISDNLISCSRFCVDRHRLGRGNLVSSGNKAPSWHSVEIVVGLSGCGVIEAEGCAPVSLGGGDAVVVPASVPRFVIKPQWELEALSMYLPPRDSQLNHPDTTLET